MPWTKLRFAPGINKEKTRYSADGTWFDSNLVRFRDGCAEMWAGWVRTITTLTFNGICRSLHRFSDLTGFQWLGVATNSRFYMASDDIWYDVTPIGLTLTLGNNPFAVVNGTPTVTVTHTAHEHTVGDTVIFSGATTTGGILAASLNAEQTIVTYIDPDHYTFTANMNASSTTSGGGAAVVAKYLFYAGSEDQIFGGGWGSASWGEEPWGGEAASHGDFLGIWSQDNWGEDLVANAQKGPIFYWDATFPSNRMLDILDMAGADGNAPSTSEFILVSHKDRHLLAFGAEEFGSGLINPMSFRWCDQENILNWDEASLTGTAGSLPLSRGSRFISAVSAQQEIVAWTDQAMYSIRYLGGELIYGADMITDFSDILGMKAATIYDSSVFWMGRSGFYAYTGSVSKIPCDVWDYVSSRLDYSQSTKTIASTNRMHDELIWYYVSVDGDLEIDSYIAFDMKESVWTVGSLSRTAWLDLDTLNHPIGASPNDHALYLHDIGADDGSTMPVSALPAFIESAPIELSSEGSFDKGDKFMFIRRILPDVTFRDFTDGVNTPRVNFNLKMMDKPGGGFGQTTANQTSRTVILPVEEFTDELQVRLRGRSLTLRLDNSTIGTRWRLGVPRIDVRTDGQR